MHRPWLLYLLTALLACGAGLAVAGLPGGGAGESLAPVPVPTAAPEAETSTTPVATTQTTAAPSTTTTTTTTTIAATTTTITTTSTTSTTTTTTTPIATTTTMPSTTTTASSSTPTTAPETTSAPGGTTASTVDRADTRIAVVNGVGIPRIATTTANELIAAGFENVSAHDTSPTDVTTVFRRSGFEAQAEDLADELDIDRTAVADIGEAPSLTPPGEFDIVIVLGTDRAP